MIVVIDGPEKAGKTTVIGALQELCNSKNLQSYVRHHGKECAGNAEAPYYFSWCSDLHMVVDPRTLVIWDRAWPSELVYGKLMQRPSRLVQNPSPIEMTLGRLTETFGMRVMLLGESSMQLASNRDETDHPVDPEAEREAFKAYGEEHGWEVHENLHTKEYAKEMASRILTVTVFQYQLVANDNQT